MSTDLLPPNPPRRRPSAAAVAALALSLALSLAPLVVPGVQAQQAQPVPTDAPKLSPEATARMQKLASELRCLVCQNQTLADSNAELAVELRREVEVMIARGDNDEQIKEYLVQRYGDFVLYRPPVQSNTALLWYGPFALLLIGAIVWLVVQRRSRGAAPSTAHEEPAAAAQHQRARDLLDD